MNVIIGDGSTPRRELAPPLEEEEELDNSGDLQRPPPLQEIENNISALLRGDIAVPRCQIDMISSSASRTRPIGFRLGVHKSESAKEMLLQQPTLGPLPATPQSSSPEPVCIVHYDIIILVSLEMYLINFLLFNYTG